MTKIDRADPTFRAWHVLARRFECAHGVAGGYMVRPWCNTPPCPRCRANGNCWRSMDTIRRITTPSHDQPTLED